MTLTAACDPAATDCPGATTFAWDTTNVVPRFPAVMRELGISGEVTASFVLDYDGAVDSTSVRVDRSTNRVFEGSAFAALSTWRFVGQPPRAAAMGERFVVTMLYRSWGRCIGVERVVRGDWLPSTGSMLYRISTCQPPPVPRDHLQRRGVVVK